MHIRYADQSLKIRFYNKKRELILTYFIFKIFFLDYFWKIMADKMVKFVDLKQETPIKRETKKRRDDFNEIYNDYINNKAKEQSSRCSQCGVPFCQIHCPLVIIFQTG